VMCAANFYATAVQLKLSKSVKICRR